MEAKVNENLYKIDIAGDELTINGKTKKYEAVKIGDASVSLIIEGQQTSAEIVEINSVEKKIVLLINQSKYEVEIKDKMDLLLQDMGMADMLTKKMSDLKSPMPGLVTQVMVATGDTVHKGDPLLILEAMKMENSLKASADGIVAAVEVSGGESVEKGQTLITFV